jgi:PAS domain S-box-containing protein
MEAMKVDLATLTPIHEGAKSLIFLQPATEETEPRVVKYLRNDNPGQWELARLNNEYALTKDLDIPGVRKAFGYQTIDGRPVLFLEYIKGVTLHHALNQSRWTPSHVLALAICLAGVLHELHRRKIIHCNISDTNIIVSPDESNATFIDFAIAAQSSVKTLLPATHELLESSPEYMSPEQTGRMSRSVDHRSDLYSFGILLYKMLTGRLPFETASAAELVHFHLAKNPDLLDQVDPQISPVLSEIVMKLLAKNPEDRYQSAYGFKYDLENCLNQLKNNNEILPFPLATKDYIDIFRVPTQKLYGREEEFKTLLKAFDHVGKGASEVLLIYGNAGVGKSSLVNNLQGIVAEKGGYFVTGRVDVYQRNAPYYTLIQAFTELVDLLLIQSREQIAELKQRVLQVVGINVGILIDVIPKLELILGPQPRIQEPGAIEGPSSFQHVLQDFVRAITQPEHPLVLFIDNLQDLDVASMELIKTLLAGWQTHYLLFIGAYRDNEITASHSLTNMVQALKRLKLIVRTIPLGNLSRESLNQLVSDELRCELAAAESLSLLVHEKTGGNPLFAVQFLRRLHEQEVLIFDSDLGRWTWDLERIRQMDITDNVITLMMQEIKKLPPETQEVLSQASCIGNVFDIETLAEVAEQSVEDVTRKLRRAIEKGLVLPAEERYPVLVEQKAHPLAGVKRRYQFSHDRVRQGAYTLASRKSRKLIHLKIARLQLVKTTDLEMEENLFSMTDHFNEGFQYLSDDQERLKVVELNLVAGRKSKRASAYLAAIWYFSMGIGMLPPKRWECHYDLSLDLYMEAIEAEYLSTNFERAQLLSSEVLTNVQDLSSRIKVYELRILFFTAQNSNKEAIEAGYEAMDLLGGQLPSEPDQIMDYADVLKKELDKKINTIEDLTHLPIMRNADHLAMMRILMNMTSPAYHTNFPLLILIILKMVHMSVQYGNSPISAFAYAAYGAFLCGKMNDLDNGYRFGLLSLTMLKQLESREYDARIVFLFNTFIRHWKEHVRESLKQLKAVSESGIDAADLEYTHYCAIHYCSDLFCSGGTLETTYQELSQYLETINRYRLEFHSYFLRIWGQMVLNLTKPSSDPSWLRGEMIDESVMLPVWMEQKNIALVFSMLCCRTILQYIFGDYHGAIKSAELAQEYENAGSGCIYLVEYKYFYALALLANYLQVDDVTQNAYFYKVAEIQKLMKKWACSAPMNYQHKYDLIEAERFRINGDALNAMKHYAKAIHGARVQGYIHEEALAYEREAEFYVRWGREDLAGFCIKKARESYRIWGATQKVEDLAKRHKYLLTREKSIPFDFAAIIQASHALSQEIHLQQLLETFMRIVMENAGAEKGILIENLNDHLFIQARGVIGQEHVQTMQQIPVEESGEVPVSVINYVTRTQSAVVLGDAVRDKTYAFDKYITLNQTKSLLCLPIVYQGKLNGLLYLENNLAKNTFTPDRLELLQALASQAAISIENARLYSNLENTINELKQAQESLRKSEQKYRLIIDTANEGFWELDSNGRTISINARVAQMLGYEREELIKQPYEAFIFPEDLSDHYLRLQKRRQGISEHYERRFRRKDGKVLWTIASGTPMMDSENRYMGSFALFTDITERKEAEQAVKKLNEELEQRVVERTAQLVATNQELEAFSYSISHDLRTPLRSIDGFSRILEEDFADKLDEYGKDCFKRIRAASNRMGQLIDDMLNLSRISRSDVRMSSVNLSELAKDIILDLRVNEPDRQVDFVIAPHLNVNADESMMRSVLENLIGNSWKFTRKKTHAKIEVGTFEHEGKWVYFVRDNGIGFDMAYANKLFKTFQRLHTEEEYEGTGIGLATVRRIINRHGGQVWAEGEIDMGATFYFTLS